MRFSIRCVFAKIRSGIDGSYVNGEKIAIKANINGSGVYGGNVHAVQS